MKRQVHYIVLHCTAVPAEAIINTIKEYWKEQTDWRHVGYHYIVGTTGRIEKLLLEPIHPGKVKGYKRNSIHFSFVEGGDNGESFNNRVTEQAKSVGAKLMEIKCKYPKAVIVAELSLGTSQN